jgi:tagaturonate reductase
VIADNIDKFRELKLRLLNGTHTFSCGLAFLAGFKTVREAMESDAIPAYMQGLMIDEIAPAIPLKIETTETTDFANKVLDRFRNPEIEHNWLAITVQYSSKMKQRNVPLLLEHYKVHNTPPQSMSLGIAAHLLFMKCEEEDGRYFGNLNGNKYLVQDDNAALYAKKWLQGSTSEVVHAILSDQVLWGTDLTVLTGLEELVTRRLNDLQEQGVLACLQQV